MAEADRRKWDARYRERGAGLREPSGFLDALDDLLPRRGRALDVAGGTGRHALWLARRGLDVTLADISGVALEVAREEAGRAGLMVRTLMRTWRPSPCRRARGTSSSASTSCGARSSPPSRPRWPRAGCWSSPIRPSPTSNAMPGRGRSICWGPASCPTWFEGWRSSGMMRVGGRRAGTRLGLPPADVTHGPGCESIEGEVS